MREPDKGRESGRRPGFEEEGEREEAQREAFRRWVSPESESTLSVFQNRTAAWG